MSASVIDSGASSKSFAVTNAVKQGCVLAPLVFNTFFSVMLHVAFRNCDKGVYLQTHSDENIFNLRRFNVKTKVSDILKRGLLFADDCALVANTNEDIQFIMDCFSNTARRFGLTVRLKKSDVLYQPKPGSSYTPPVVKVYDTPLTSVDKFSYLGSTLSQNIVVDDDISMRLSRVGAALAT